MKKFISENKPKKHAVWATELNLRSVSTERLLKLKKLVELLGEKVEGLQ